MDVFRSRRCRRGIAFVVFFACLAGLSSAALATRAAQDAQGEAVVNAIRHRYQENGKTCGNASIFTCSGVLLRGTVSGLSYESWDPNPASAKPGGVSFTWLRLDANTSKLAYHYGKGFIIYPPGHTDAYAGDTYKVPGMVDVSLLCFFPEDGDTDRRPPDGCGANEAFPGDSGACQSQKIATADQWQAHWRKVSESRRRDHECGIALAEGRADAVALSNATPAIIHGIGDSFYTQDEVIVGAWGIDDDKKIPLEAFFYVYMDGQEVQNANLRTAARYDQCRFQEKTGTWRPLISIRLPKDKSGKATFDYNPAYQGVVGDGATCAVTLPSDANQKIP
jgi:hypothetical protein